MPRNQPKFIPNYQRIINDIVGQIQNGTLEADVQLPSERELCLHYKVSRQTIRTAITSLTAGGWIDSRPGKGNFVCGAGAGNAAAESREPTKQIGVICNRRILTNELKSAYLFWGLSSALSPHGYTIALSVDTPDRANKLEPVFPEWIKAGTMDGYILASAHERVQHRFAILRVPTVSFGYLWTGADLPSVAMDFHAIYSRCIQFLARENFLPCCSFMFHPRSVDGAVYADKIIAGHREGTARAGIPASQARVERYSATTYELMMSLRRALKGNPRTIILDSAMYLDNVMEILAACGRRVPEDILVMTIQSAAYASPHHYRTATLKLPPSLMACRAGEKLLRLIETGTAEPRNELLDIGEFVLPVSMQADATSALTF